jgi:hypothetical protein
VKVGDIAGLLKYNVTIKEYPIMKIAEYNNLKTFLTVLFNYFKDNEIESSANPVDDYYELLDKILDAEFTGYSCNPELEHYSINFRLNRSIESPESYMLNLNKYGDDKSRGLSINLSEKDRDSSIIFSWYEGALPFFLIDFMDEAGMLVTENSGGTFGGQYNIDDFMDIYEFIAFLGTDTDLEDTSIDLY